MMLWYKYFMEAQGYTAERNLLYQDRKLTTLLANNDRMLASDNSKHTKNSFFLITDRVAHGNRTIQYMETTHILAGVNTKLLWGLLYRKFCHEMMGVLVEYDDDMGGGEQPSHNDDQDQKQGACQPKRRDTQRDRYLGSCKLCSDVRQGDGKRVFHRMIR